MTSDPKWITQILNNLIGNSIKYTVQGSVQVLVESRGGASPSEPRILRLRVIDTGKGIAPHEQERILQPFEQIRTDTNIEGTGLGLAIVNSIVDQMQGTLTLDSSLDKGSTFTVDLPMHDMTAPRSNNMDTDPRTESHHPQMESPTSSSKDIPMDTPQPGIHAHGDSTDSKNACHILLADDNELNRFVASKLLARWGFDVLEATNGKEAIDAWQENGPCINLIDVQMPEMDGIELAQRCNEISPDTKVMFITGFAAVTLKASREQPNAKVLSKPFHLRDLVLEVERVLDDRISAQFQ